MIGVNVMIKIAIVDDDEAACEKIKSVVDTFFLDKPLEFRTYQFRNAEHLLKKIAEMSFSIILLDIDMPGLDGLMTAKLLREKSINSIIIFITSDITYMEKAFGLNVFGFVHKDKLKHTLPEVIKKCIDEINSHVMLTFKTKNGLITISKGDIIYADMESRKVMIHTCKEQFLVNLNTLADFYEKVEKFDNFVYINRSTLINLAYVMSITNDKCILLKGVDIKIPISRDKVFEVSKALMNWISKRSLV